jgi:hypothetical protein
MAPDYRAARHEQDAFFELLIGATRAKIFGFLQSGALHNISTRGSSKAPCYPAIRNDWVYLWDGKQSAQYCRLMLLSAFPICPRLDSRCLSSRANALLNSYVDSRESTLVPRGYRWPRSSLHRPFFD